MDAVPLCPARYNYMGGILQSWTMGKDIIALSNSNSVYNKVMCSLLCNMGVFSCFGLNKTEIFFFLFLYYISTFCH